MKRISITFLYLLLCSTLYSQVDSSAESFYPSQVGNVWRYRIASIELQSKITRDSIAPGVHYIFLDGSQIPAYKIDSLLNVTTSPTQGAYADLRYKLTAKKGEIWISKDTTQDNPMVRVVARVEDIFWGMVLGTVTQNKRIGYYIQPVTDTTYFSFWRNDTYLAAGFGYLFSIYDASQTPDVELIGCIINGKKYGTVVSVPYDSKNPIQLSYKLYPAFPNPFNPSTTISYQLPVKSSVILKVYDILGKEVASLVNDEQEEGSYQFNFAPPNLSSGIYLVRMTAGHFTQTTKIIYSK